MIIFRQSICCCCVGSTNTKVSVWRGEERRGGEERGRGKEERGGEGEGGADADNIQ